jgi:16S rRNA (guanine527-N7)-methyltransferase
MTHAQKKFLQNALAQNHFHFNDEIQNKFLDYLSLLDKWNKVFNLTAITNPEEQVMLHILDSLSVNIFLKGEKMIDVGTGAGLPGIPLALINPEKKFTLLDSNSKKTRFLIQAISELSIKNIEVVHSRCEDFHPQQGFDTIVSRAFASIEVMLEATRHLVCQDGIFLAMKGMVPEDEIKKIPKTFKLESVNKLTIKGLNAERCVVLIRKQENG